MSSAASAASAACGSASGTAGLCLETSAPGSRWGTRGGGTGGVRCLQEGGGLCVLSCVAVGRLEAPQKAVQAEPRRVVFGIPLGN